MEVRSPVFHLLQTAYTNFKRNKIRTFLTSLGIMIGVLSVVMLIALGLGLKNYIQEQFESLGTNLIAVFPGSTFSDEGGIESLAAGWFGGTEFDEKDVRELQKINLLEYVAPVSYNTTIVRADRKEELGYVMGSNEEIFLVLNTEILKGSFWTKSDVRRKSKRVVLGFEIAKKLFDDPKKAVGKTIEISKNRYTVIGVIKKKGDREMDAGVYIPYRTTFGNLNPSKKFLMLYLGVRSEEEIDEAKRKVEEVMLKRYDEDEFSVTESTEMLEVVNQIFGVINSVLIAIGSISLLVGGIGIMNIMYATVTERIKEIGIRRAIGATKKDILFQFLTESVIHALLGGVLGLLLSIGIVLGIRVVFPAAINPLAVVIALGVSSAIGIFFGVFPARRAANLPPIEAIRYE
jgi:putative ABC transport system permease protein